MAGIKKAAVTEVFNGQSDIVIFDEVTDYNTATFTSVTSSGLSLGQIVGDTTSWDGEDPTTDNIVDEQGGIIIAAATAGTYAFSCDVASTSKAMQTLLLKAKEVSEPGTSASFSEVSELTKAVDLPVITRPIAIVNDEGNKFILFPKAKIVGSLKLDSKLWRIHISATAELVDTATLGTFMMGKGKATADASV